MKAHPYTLNWKDLLLERESKRLCKRFYLKLRLIGRFVRLNFIVIKQIVTTITATYISFQTSSYARRYLAAAGSTLIEVHRFIAHFNCVDGRK